MSDEVLTEETKEWLKSKEYKNVSTVSLLQDLHNIRTEFADRILNKKVDCGILLETLLHYLKSSPNGADMSKSEQRSKVKKYIHKSYCYWNCIDARTPMKSVMSIVDLIKQDYAQYGDVLDEIIVIAKSSLKHKDWLDMCTRSQKMMFNTLFYVHIKRCPRTNEKGEQVYSKTRFCDFVDLNKWLSTYDLDTSA